MGEVKSILTSFLKRHEKEGIFHGIIGNPEDGSVFATDDNGSRITGMVWVRDYYAPSDGDSTSASLRLVRCRKVTPLYNSHVVMRYSPVDGQLEITEEDPFPAMAMMGDHNANVPGHKWTHEYMGTDPVFISGLQFKPLLVRPTDVPSLSVYIEPYVYSYEGAEVTFGGATVDLTSYLPAAGQEIAVVISIDLATNLPTVTAGTASTFFTNPLFAMPYSNADLIAITTSGKLRLVGVRLYAGQTQVRTIDFIGDLRHIGGPPALPEYPLSVVHGGTGLSASALGDLLYGSATNVWSRLGGNTTTTRKFLRQTGTGAVSAAPVWDTLVVGDIPSLTGLYANLALSNLSGATSDMLPQYLLRQPTANWSIDASASYMGGIGGAAVAAQKLTIYTGADANKGLQIRRNSATQSADLQQWTDSSGTVLSAVDSSGHLQVGTIAPGANQLVRIFGTGASTSAFFAIAPTANFNNGSTAMANNVIGMNAFATTGASYSGTMTGALIGYSGGATHNGSGNLTQAVGARVLIDNTGNATIISAYGLLINTFTQTAGAGTYTNIYGIYVNDQTLGTTSNYALYTNKGLIRFGDKTTITGWQDVTQLIVTGFTTQTGTVAQILRNDGATNTVNPVLTIAANSTGTPAAGFGAGLIFELKSSTTNAQSAGLITTEWATATHASRKARMVLSVYDTAVREGIRLEASGTAAMLGFFGTAAIVQPANSVAIDDLLVNLGLRASGGTADFTAAMKLTDKITVYNNIATQGYGVPAVVTRVGLTGQTADIGSTNLTNANVAGEYKVSYYIVTTTADAAAGTLPVALTWNDGAAAQTLTSATINLATLGSFAQGVFYVRLGSGSIAYSTTVTGIYGTSQYALYIDIERVN